MTKSIQTQSAISQWEIAEHLPANKPDFPRGDEHQRF